MLLVTGATGFLGSAVVQHLADAGLPVRATVRNPERASILPEQVERVRADLADEDSLVEAMRGCDGVFHLAASLGPLPEDTRRSNVDGTARVLSAAEKAGVRRFVYTSSSAAIVTADGLVSEQAENRTAMTDPYSTTKAEAEGLVLAAAGRGLDACSLNPVMIYGPSPFGPSSYNSLFLAAARGEVTEIVDAPVGWVLAEDVARAHLLAYEKGEAGRRYVLVRRGRRLRPGPAPLRRPGRQQPPGHHTRPARPSPTTPRSSPAAPRSTANSAPSASRTPAPEPSASPPEASKKASRSPQPGSPISIPLRSGAEGKDLCGGWRQPMSLTTAQAAPHRRRWRLARRRGTLLP